MPEDVWESVPLKIHVGRHLLGFRDKPDRKKYLAAPATAKPPEQVIGAYQKLLSEAKERHGEAEAAAFDSDGPLAEHFDKFVEAAIGAGRHDELASILKTLSPHWDHNSGYAKLGAAAFEADDHRLAESFLLKLRDSYQDSHRSEEMGLLAQIWFKRGEQERAKKLLLDCLRKLVEESKTASGLDKQLFEKWFQNHRATLLKLFPSESGIPNSTLR